MNLIISPKQKGIKKLELLKLECKELSLLYSYQFEIYMTF